MTRAQQGGMKRLRTTLAAVAGVRLMVVISLPFVLAKPGDTIELQLREAKTPADHQALATWYEKEEQAAQQLASKHFMMQQVYAAARAMERHDQAGEHCTFVAKKYQDMAKEYETFAAAHKMMAEQRP